MTHPLENKRALVTGGSRGIGAAIVKRLAGDAAHVALTYVSKPDQAQATVKAAHHCIPWPQAARSAGGTPGSTAPVMAGKGGMARISYCAGTGFMV
jgi:NAD(P)-dependent dehydrogenase (short-subunit alcohol dehydrogenase family)